MNKVVKIFVFLVILSFPFSAISHVEHYENLNRLEFDIYRNNKRIGTHIFLFKRIDDELIVESKINFEIKKLGVVLYSYNVEGTERYKDGQLVQFNSKTNQNRKKKYVNIKLENNEYLIDGSSYKGKAPIDYIIGTWWNHSIIKSKAQISAVSGRIIEQEVNFLGKETLNLNGKTYETLHFNFSSSDQKLAKDKKLNTDVWYDEKNLNWVKATFKKKGDWEYKLLILE
tara:strand:- start:7 stop:690 length:684 start_codon:yes stop_codon:yes gene_type:complete